MTYYVDDTNQHAPRAELIATHDRLSALLDRVAAGDTAAMATLYDETSPLIFGLLTRMLGAGTRAEETLVEVYSCVWRKAASYRPADASPIAWLVTNARRCASRKDLSERPDTRPREASKLPTRNDTDRANEALRGLASKHREALQLSYFSDLRQVESAFDLSTRQARTLVSGALRSYAEVLGKLGNS